MKWGTTPPSEPGWYWFRADCNDDPHIIKLVERDELLVQYGPSTRATLPWLKDNTPNPQWAGPIPMPEGEQ